MKRNYHTSTQKLRQFLYVIASVSNDKQGPSITGSNVCTVTFSHAFSPLSSPDSSQDGNQISYRVAMGCCRNRCMGCSQTTACSKRLENIICPRWFPVSTTADSWNRNLYRNKNRGYLVPSKMTTNIHVQERVPLFLTYKGHIP